MSVHTLSPTRIRLLLRPAVVLMTMVLVVGLGVLVRSAGPVAAAPPPGFTDQAVAQVGSATALDFTPDGRLLIADRDGQLRVYSNGTLLPTPALNLSVCTAGEQGFLGVTVDSNFASNGFIYVYYTATNPCRNVVSRFTLGANNVAGNEVELVQIPVATGAFPNHNAGDVKIGQDGHLYISTGDAAVGDNSQNLSNLNGAILRVTTPDGGIPPGNPFTGAGSVRCNATGVAPGGQQCQEIYAYGLRNPFRIAVDPNSSSTRIFVNDVGGSGMEEINELAAGANYGWPTCEGSCNVPGMTNPIYEYPTVQGGQRGTISGGAFIPNGVWPAEYDNSYIYGEYVRDYTRVVRCTPGCNSQPFDNSVSNPVHLEFGTASGVTGLYYTQITGEVRRVVGPDPSIPPPPVPPPPVPPPPVPPPPVPPPPQPPGDCTASYTVINEWPGGFQAEVTVTNTSGGTGSGWQVSWTYANGQQITQLWNGEHSQSGASVTVTSTSWNGGIPPSGSVGFGFLASWNNATNSVPSPISCTLT
jgi:glucose/arabinose dehydrogenase